jgi:four helix bundle protein
MAGRNYADLLVWQQGMDLVEAIYGITTSFPKDERFGLTNQLRRASVSIPANIAEGQGRQSPRDFLRFLSIAYGSLREVETLILIAERLKFLSPAQTEPLMSRAAELGRLLNGLSNSLRSRLNLADE